MEALQEVLVMLPVWVELICQALGAITIVATVVVRFTPSKKDDEVVGRVVGKIWDLLGWLPTIGVNPKTKSLKEALASLK